MAGNSPRADQICFSSTLCGPAPVPTGNRCIKYGGGFPDLVLSPVPGTSGPGDFCRCQGDPGQRVHPGH